MGVGDNIRFYCLACEMTTQERVFIGFVIVYFYCHQKDVDIHRCYVRFLALHPVPWRSLYCLSRFY